MSARSMRLLYTLALRLGTPLILLYLLWRSRRQPEYRRHWGERFGLSFAARPAGRLIWIHAVSVGETRAAEPLIAALRAAWPVATILLTHMTPTGRATVLPGAAQRAYLPYDYPGALRRFVRHWRPDLCILMETEVWPNLVAACVAAGVPVALVNARLSQRSLDKAHRFAPLLGEAMGGLTAVLAQTESDAGRLGALGARHVSVTGNLKFDIAPDPERIALGAEFRARIGARPVLLAASTREGEEGLLLDAWMRARARLPAATLLVLVPRHPQRFDEVAGLVARAGLTLQRRGDGAPLAAATEVWLGDSMGEMVAYYSVAGVAYIGGSLVPLGGQNLIEACALGCPVLLGPHTYNFAQASDDAIAAGAAVRIADADALMEQAARLLGDAAARDAMAQCALDFAAAHRGATARTVERLSALMDRSTVAAAR